MGISIREIDSFDVKNELLLDPHKAAGRILQKVREESASGEYAGDVAPELAWALFSAGAAELVDVRTAEELQDAGFVPFAKHVEWQKGRDREDNPGFLGELDTAAGKRDVVVLFLCRSGVRSVAAAKAATQAGYGNAFSVLEGFEGDGGLKRGWLIRGLPSASSGKYSEGD